MISLIAAIQQKDSGIGFRNELLFRISDDLKRFKALTSGHPIIMGRKTFDSIGGKPLPNRTNIVITRQQLSQDGVIFCNSLEQALEQVELVEKEKSEEVSVYIIGGAEIYQQALPFADQLDLTIVDSDVVADVFFPDYSNIFTKAISEEKRVDKKTGLKYSWVTLSK